MQLFEQVLLQEADKSRFFKPLWDEFSGDNDLVQKDGVTYAQLLNFVNKDDPLLKKQFQLRNVDWQKGSDAMRWVAICQAYMERDQKQKADESNKAAYKQKDVLSMIKAEKLLVLAGENEPAYDVDFVHLSQLDNGKFTFVVPMTYEAAMFCDSAKCGGEGAKWCIGYEKTPDYWNDHTQDGQLFILAFNNESFAKGPNNREKDTLKYMITLSPEARDTEAWLQSDEPEDTIPIYKFKKFFGHDAIEMATVFANRILVEENRYSECNQDTFWDRDEEAPTYPWDDSDLIDSVLDYDDFLAGIYNIENKQPEGNGKIGSKGSWAKQLVYDKAYNEVIFDGSNKKVIPAQMQIGGNFDKGIFDIPTFCDWLKKCNVDNASSVTIKNARIEKMIHEPEASDNSMDVYLENCEIDDLIYTDYSDNIEFNIDKNCYIGRMHWPCSSEHFDSDCAKHLHVEDGATIHNEEYEEEDEQLNESKDYRYKAKVGELYLQGNDFTSDPEEADIFESETEPRQRINQMKKDKKYMPKGDITMEKIKEETAAGQGSLFDEILSQKKLKEYTEQQRAALSLGTIAIIAACAFGIDSCKDNVADKQLKELGCFENYMKYNIDGDGSLSKAVGIGDTQSKAMYACIVSLAREKNISIDKAAKMATSHYGEKLKKNFLGAFTNGFKGRITGVSVGKDTRTGDRIVRVDSEWKESHTSGSGEHKRTYYTTEHGTVYIPMSEGNQYGMDDDGKSVNIGGNTYVFDESRAEKPSGDKLDEARVKSLSGTFERAKVVELFNNNGVDLDKETTSAKNSILLVDGKREGYALIEDDSVSIWTWTRRNPDVEDGIKWKSHNYEELEEDIKDFVAVVHGVLKESRFKHSRKGGNDIFPDFIMKCASGFLQDNGFSKTTSREPVPMTFRVREWDDGQRNSILEASVDGAYTDDLIIGCGFGSFTGFSYDIITHDSEKDEEAMWSGNTQEELRDDLEEAFKVCMANSKAHEGKKTFEIYLDELYNGDREAIGKFLDSASGILRSELRDLMTKYMTKEEFSKTYSDIKGSIINN